MNEYAPRQHARTGPSLPLALAAGALAILLLISAGEQSSVHARGAPHRNDRRPDRETRIRYPKQRTTSNRTSGHGQILRSAPTPSADAAPVEQPAASETTTPPREDE